jgi:hypothetical protein
MGVRPDQTEKKYADECAFSGLSDPRTNTRSVTSLSKLLKQRYSHAACISLRCTRFRLLAAEAVERARS